MVTRETSISLGLAEIGVPATDQQIRRLARLAELLENDAVDLGFLGPNEASRVLPRHLLESAALLPHLIPVERGVDVGSGAGLPGLVLAALGCRMTLIDAQARRAAFLDRAGRELGIDLDVRHARAETEGRGPLREQAGTVVARALAVPSVALELCMPLVRVGGRVLLVTSPDGAWTPADGTLGESDRVSVVSEESSGATGDQAPGTRRAVQASPPSGTEGAGGPSRVGSVPQVPADVEAVAEMLGGESVRWEGLSVPGAGARRWVMMVDKRRPTPTRFPRRPGVPKRRPLGGDVASVD